MAEEGIPRIIEATAPARPFHEHVDMLIHCTTAFSMGLTAGKGFLGAEAMADTFLTMVFCEGVNRFVTYLSTLMTTVLEKFPGALKRSGAKYPLTYILDHEDMDDLRSAIIEDRVFKASMDGVEELCRFFDGLDFELLSADTVEALKPLIAYRNIHIHNNGVVNRRFLKHYPDLDLQVGERVTYSREDLLMRLAELEQLVVNIDKRAVSKWGLATSPYRSTALPGTATPADLLPEETE